MVSDIQTQVEPTSLCWSCLRATWGCLCDWPQRRPPGVETVEIITESGEQVEIVINCPNRWPE